MAQSSMNGMFRERAIRKATGPEDLDRLAPLAPPRAWLILAVMIAMSAAGLAWGVLGRVPVTVQGSGVAVGADAIVFVPFLEGHRIAAGMPVRMGASGVEATGRVLEVSAYPSTRVQIQSLLGNDALADWFAARGPSVWVRVRPEGTRRLAPGTPLEARVVVSERRPISLLWGGR